MENIQFSATRNPGGSSSQFSAQFMWRASPQDITLTSSTEGSNSACRRRAQPVNDKDFPGNKVAFRIHKITDNSGISDGAALVKFSNPDQTPEHY